MEYIFFEEFDYYNKGYKKIIFYFYQIFSYLNVELIFDVIKNIVDIVKEVVFFVIFFFGIFNFILIVFSEGFGCFFLGLNVVMKELIFFLGVFVMLISVQVILILYFIWNRLWG